MDRGPIRIGPTTRARVIERQHDLSIGPTVKELAIPRDWLKDEVRDRGSYLLLLRLPRDRRVTVGQLGELRFRKGFYVYVGSAMRNLSARLAWHQRTRKRLHWHIDYLRQVSDHVASLPIRSSQREECSVAQALTVVLTPGPSGFGCSDCHCPTHLYYSRTNPLHDAAFHGVLQRFRMKPPEGD